jgi:hypothetical protein
MHTPHLRTSAPSNLRTSEPPNPSHPVSFMAYLALSVILHLSAWTHGVSSRAQFDIRDIAIFVWSLGGLRTPCSTAIIPISSYG